MLANGELHKLKMEVVQVGNKVQGVVDMSLTLLTLLAKEVYNLHIPVEDILLLLFVGTLDAVDKCSIYCLRAKLQGSQQVLDLPKVEYILGDILFAFLKCYKHSYNQSEVLSTLLGALGTLLK